MTDSPAVIPTNSAAATANTTTVATTPAGSGNVATGAAATWRGFLSGKVQQVISQLERVQHPDPTGLDPLCIRAARDSSLLRMNVLDDLSVPRWKPEEIEPVEDVTESLLIFLLHCRSTGTQVSELSLAESTWDELGGLEIL